jgi:peroxiredoxin
MLPLGTAAPDFSLPDVVTGKTVALADFAKARALLVAFICNHCPFVIHLRAPLVALIKENQPGGLAAVGISSNDILNYPDDAPAKMVKTAKTAGFTFPYLFDEAQAVAKAYHAACTPDFFLFDAARKLVYRGQFDDSRPGNGKAVTGADLRAAMEATLAGKSVAAVQKPSIGCNIKWKVGQAPAWFTR